MLGVGCAVWATAPVEAKSTSPTAPENKKEKSISASGEAEEVKVTANNAPDGASGHSAGAGMMPPQTVPKARSAFTRDFIAHQRSMWDDSRPQGNQAVSFHYFLAE